MAAEVKIPLPEGMSQEDFLKLFNTFQKQRVATGARDKAVRSATKDLIALHKPEYEKILEKYLPKGK
jgi:hypothetical protein